MFRTVVANLTLSANSTLNGSPITHKISFLPFGLIIFIITIFGIIGNILCIAVLIRPKMRSTYSTITLGLTLSDIIYLLTKFFRFGVESLLVYLGTGTSYTEFFLPIIGPYIRAVNFTASTASTYFTIGVAVDRFMAVKFAVAIKNHWNRRNAFILSICLALFSIIYNLPRWWEFETVEVQNQNGDFLKYDMEKTHLRENSNYRMFFIFWSYLFVMNLIPIVSLFILNFIIWKSITEAKNSGKIVTSLQNREHSFTLMLIAVVVVFLICSIPWLIVDTLDYLEINTSSFWTPFANFLLTVNSTVNFLLYVMWGAKFRNELKAMMPQWMRKCCTGKKTVKSDDEEESSAMEISQLHNPNLKL